MTKEQFYNLAATRKEITSPSVFRLIVRTYDKNIKGYRKWRGKDDYYFDIATRSNLYSSKDKAESALSKVISEAEQFNHAVHSAIIERLPVDIPLEENGEERARQRLLLKLHEIGADIQKEMKNDKWAQHTSLERGNPIKKFSGPL